MHGSSNPEAVESFGHGRGTFSCPWHALHSLRIRRRQQQGNVDHMMQAVISNNITLASTTRLTSSLERLSESSFCNIDTLLEKLTMPNREFANSTILTIAHRLRTVIDYDRVKKIRSCFLCITHGLPGDAPRRRQNRWVWPVSHR